jgi:hypothetical protein
VQAATLLEAPGSNFGVTNLSTDIRRPPEKRAHDQSTADAGNADQPRHPSPAKCDKRGKGQSTQNAHRDGRRFRGVRSTQFFV